MMQAILMLVAALLFPAKAHAAPVLTYVAWSADQTNLFTQIAGNTSWQGNDLVAQYRQEYGSAAWAQTKSDSYLTGRLPSPANAVGIAFNVTASYYPTSWVVGLDLGCAGCGFSASAQIRNAFSTPDPTVVQDSGGGDSYYLRSSLFPLFNYTYSGGLWSIELFLPDEWILNRNNLDERFAFYATNTQSGPSNLVDGVTRFDNIRWILSDTLPVPVPPPSGSIPEPTSFLLFCTAFIPIAVAQRRKVSSSVSIDHEANDSKTLSC